MKFDAPTIAKVLKEANRLDLYEQVFNMRTEMLEMQEANKKLKEENEELTSKLKIKEEIIPKNDCYWINKNGQEDGPFCSKCFDDDSKLMRLHYSGEDGYYICPKCENGVYAKPGLKTKPEYRTFDLKY
jgi:regulator of replication initiation timing